MAAHWAYKQGNRPDGQASWIRDLIEILDHAEDAEELLENTKLAMYQDRIFAFTPKGTLLQLPKGATTVDFAYAVHSDIGNSCVACRINRRLAPLSEELQSGQTVEIITAPGSHPNPSWLNFVVSGKARSTIRHHLKNQRHTESIELGRRLLDKALQNLGSNLKSVDQSLINTLLEDNEYDDFDLVLEDIGLGNRVAYLTARRLVADASSGESALDASASSPEKKNSKKPHASAFAIKGAEGLMMNFAKCCRAIPGDPIIGHISAGRGIVVHVEGCRNIADAHKNPERCIDLSWEDDVRGEFHVELSVELNHQRGIIAELANKISSMDVPIEKISTEDRDARVCIVRLEIAVHNRVHLASIMRRIRTIKSVSKVVRLKA